MSANKDEVLAFARRTGFPVVAKVVGPVHKSDVGGVVLNIKGEQHLAFEFERMMQIPEVTGILVQPMLKGTELFVGAKYEAKFAVWAVSLWKCLKTFLPVWHRFLMKRLIL